MKKIIFILLLILTTTIAHWNFYWEQNIFDIKSEQWSNWYNKYWIKWESPITHEEKLKRLEIANYYADFFWKNYFLLQNKYIKPEYQWIPYEN